MLNVALHCIFFVFHHYVVVQFKIECKMQCDINDMQTVEIRRSDILKMLLYNNHYMHIKQYLKLGLYSTVIYYGIIIMYTYFKSILYLVQIKNVIRNTL